MMSQEIDTVAQLADLVGRSLAPTDWILLDQARVDGFAACTDDRQFIHVDPERAARDSPFGGTVVHGYLALSLLGGHQPPDFPRLTDLRLVINYGLNSVRFTAPVLTGSRVRIHTKVLAANRKGPGRILLKQEKTLEIEGEEKPAFNAEQLLLYVSLTAP